MDADMDSSSERACDQCRTRKVKCDRKLPCANCRIAKRSCTFSDAPPKPRAARQRVLISSQYERKLDYLEERLCRIEGLLTSMIDILPKGEAGDHNGRNPPSISPHDLPTTIAREFSKASQSEDSCPNFEGSSSLNSHTLFASNFIQHNIQQTPLLGLDTNLQSALHALQDIATPREGKTSTQDEPFRDQNSLPTCDLSGLPMPPVTLVLNILREIKEIPPVTLTLLNCFITVDDLIRHCQKVYFAMEKVNFATFIIVNGGLCYIFNEKSYTETNPDTKADYIKHRDICKENLETVLSTLNIFLPAKLENIQALLLGVTHAIQVSQPSLAWTMNCTVAQMCQTLGYHRLSSSSDCDDIESSSKSSVFWFAYIIDKSLSLKLGRGSAFPDHDIVISHETGETSTTVSWKRIFQKWIEHAEIQGEVYDQLYSPRALSAPPDQRTQSAYVLAEKVKALERGTKAMKEELEITQDLSNYRFGESNAWDLTFESEFVSFQSTLTLIYRAIHHTPHGSGSFHPECLQSARQALQSHERCMHLAGSNVASQTSYIYWTILFSPFISFIVIFCHTIESSSSDDLLLLERFMLSLQPIHTVSLAINRIHHLAQVLYRIAVSYIQSKKDQADLPDFEPIGSEFDAYLSQNGFMPSVLDFSPDGNTFMDRLNQTW